MAIQINNKQQIEIVDGTYKRYVQKDDLQITLKGDKVFLADRKGTSSLHTGNAVIVDYSDVTVPTVTSGQELLNHIRAFLKMDESLEKADITEPSGGTTYVGYCLPGKDLTNKDEAVWAIKKVTVTGATTTIEWADGNMNFDNIWDNRATTVNYQTLQ